MSENSFFFKQNSLFKRIYSNFVIILLLKTLECLCPFTVWKRELPNKCSRWLREFNWCESLDRQLSIKNIERQQNECGWTVFLLLFLLVFRMLYSTLHIHCPAEHSVYHAEYINSGFIRTCTTRIAFKLTYTHTHTLLHSQTNTPMIIWVSGVNFSADKQLSLRPHGIVSNHSAATLQI